MALSFSSCQNIEFRDVDFSVERSVQISYNDLVYNGLVSFDGERLILVIKDFLSDNEDAFFSLGRDSYIFTYSDIKFSGDSNELSEVSLPKLFYMFFLETGNVVSFPTDSDVFNTTVSDKFFTLVLEEGSAGIPFISFNIN